MKRILILSLLQLLAFSVFSQIDIAMDKIVRNNTNYLQIRVTNTSTEDMMIIQPVTNTHTIVEFRYYQGDTSLNRMREVALRTEEDRKANRVRSDILLRKGETEDFLVEWDGISANVVEATKVKVSCIVAAIGTRRYTVYKDAEFPLSSSSLPKKPIEQVTDSIGAGPV